MDSLGDSLEKCCVSTAFYRVVPHFDWCFYKLKRKAVKITLEKMLSVYSGKLQGKDKEIIFFRFLISKRKVCLVEPSLRHQLGLSIVLIYSIQNCGFLLTVCYWTVYSKRFNRKKLKAKITFVIYFLSP